MDVFEEAAWEVEKDINDVGNNENVIEFLRNSDTATVFFTQKRYITTIKELAQKYPDKVEICCENSDGSIVAHIPVKAVHISIHPGRVLSDEEKEIARERLQRAREVRFQNQNAEEADS